MSTPIRSSAAATQTPSSKGTPNVTDSPGNWKHPRLAEITRRQGRTVFSEKNVKTIVYNVGALALLLVLRLVMRMNTPPNLLSPVLTTYVSWAYLLLQAVPLVNIAAATLPLIRRQDDLSDIPLTPGQRKLLGLPPSPAPPTPNSKFSTPPRYSRTPSRAGSAGSSRSFSSPAVSANGSPASDRIRNGSPYSPAGASPLLQKAIAGGRRPSFGSLSPFGASTASSLLEDVPPTPTPIGGKRSSVGLNNKWLYERGRRTSSNTFLH